MANPEVTHDGEQHIKAWLSAQERLQRAKDELNRAQCDLANSTNALAKWILPEDAKPGEKICVWYYDALIQVEPSPHHPNPGGDAIITTRKRGREFSRRAA